MTKQEITNLINAKIKGQGSQVDTGGALPTILSAILGLIPDSVPTEFGVTIAESGTTVGRTTTYDVTNSQSDIDAFIASVESDPTKALMVVKDGDVLIRFEQIEVSDETVSGIAVIGSGVYSLHLMSTDAGGDSYFSYTANAEESGLRIFVPTVDWEAETISLGDASVKYGLDSEKWDKLVHGIYNATPVNVTESGNEVTKILVTKAIYTEVPVSLEYENSVIFESGFQIKLTLDGNYVISFGS